jgi:serine/threonine protein phosphatase PrpC
MPTQAVALLGRDYPQLGPLGAVALPSGGALALSRGQEPKPYRHVDPNEDAALIVRAPAGVLLSVADGHNGVAASELAIDAVRASAGDLLAGAPSQFATGIEALVESLAEPLHEVAPSRTSLLVAALVADRCVYACIGDCSLYRASAREPVTEDTQPVLGAELRFDDERRRAVFGDFARVAGERIVLVTDGVTNFVTSDVVPDLLVREGDDGECARAICRAAMRMGAGDNVAVALFSGAV